MGWKWVWHKDSTRVRVPFLTGSFGLLMPAGLLLAAVLACAGDDPRTVIDTDSVNHTPGAVRDCGVPAAGVQIERGIGVLQVGAPVKLLVGRCQIVDDTVVTGLEGMAARRLYIVVQGDTVVAEMEEDTVWRVSLTTGRFRTGDSLGVGSPAGNLTSREGARALVGEGEIYLTIEEACGVSFRLDGVSFSNVASAPSPESAVRLVPDTSKVDLVLLTPCTTGKAEVLTNSASERVLKHQ